MSGEPGGDWVLARDEMGYVWCGWFVTGSSERLRGAQVPTEELRGWNRVKWIVVRFCF